MTIIFLGLLFILQVIGFYFIALLYMKVSKFDELERKQNRLMKEMEDAMAVYLAEIKDENEQLLEKLAVPIQEKGQDVDSVKDRVEQEVPVPPPIQMPHQTMWHHARKSYERIQQHELPVDDDLESAGEMAVEDDDRSRAIKLAAAGLSVEEIARKLDKGRTEVELILKFK